MEIYHKNIKIFFFSSFQGMISRILLTRYKIYNKEKNIKATQEINTDNGKCL